MSQEVIETNIGVAVAVVASPQVGLVPGRYFSESHGIWRSFGGIALHDPHDELGELLGAAKRYYVPEPGSLPDVVTISTHNGGLRYFSHEPHGALVILYEQCEDQQQYWFITPEDFKLYFEYSGGEHREPLLTQ